MDYVFVQSRAIRYVGYDPLTAILEVEFQNGYAYQYLKVPPELYRRLLEAKSAGRFFNAEIKPRFKARVVDGIGTALSRAEQPPPSHGGENGIWDQCDVNCGVTGGLCAVPDCGQSVDCNLNGVPDECELQDNDCIGYVYPCPERNRSRA